MGKRRKGIFSGYIGHMFDWETEKAVRKLHHKLENEGRLDELDNALEAFETNIPEVMEQFAGSAGTQLAKSFLRKTGNLRRFRNRQRRFFERVHRKAWGSAITKLELLLQICLEVGQDFYEEFHVKVPVDNDLRLIVVANLQARACLVASEVVSLLSSGHADGAAARWRTMHELLVVAIFMAEKEEDVAERYIAHTVVANYRAAKQYQQFQNELSDGPLEEGMVEELRKEVQLACEKYGKSFKDPYGWASHALGLDNRRKPVRFSDIEEAVEFEHLRPYYKFASERIHAEPRGFLHQLGTPPDSTGSFILAGPSIFGLADPAIDCTMSLWRITGVLMSLKPTLESMVLASTLRNLADEVAVAFLEAAAEVVRNQEKSSH